jgi:hypothetical protein
MSFIFEGNAFLDYSFIQNSTISNTLITASNIFASSIDMLDTGGNYQNITNVKDPINPQDAVTKNYIDSLIVSNTCGIYNTSETLISSNLSGCYTIYVKNIISGGPSGIFMTTKNESNICGHVAQLSLCPGTSTSNILNITWPNSDGIYLSKSESTYDGIYNFKIIGI